MVGVSVALKFRNPSKTSVLFLSESRKKRRLPADTAFSLTATFVSEKGGGGGGGGGGGINEDEGNGCTEMEERREGERDRGREKEKGEREDE